MWWPKSAGNLKMMINVVLTKSELIYLVKFGADFEMSFNIILAGFPCIYFMINDEILEQGRVVEIGGNFTLLNHILI